VILEGLIVYCRLVQRNNILVIHYLQRHRSVSINLSKQFWSLPNHQAKPFWRSWIIKTSLLVLILICSGIAFGQSLAGFVLGGDFTFVCNQPNQSVACTYNSLSVNQSFLGRPYGVIADSQNGQGISQVVIVSHTREYQKADLDGAIHIELSDLFNHFFQSYGQPQFVNIVNSSVIIDKYNFVVMQWSSESSEARVLVTYNPLSQGYRIMAVMRYL